MGVGPPDIEPAPVSYFIISLFPTERVFSRFVWLIKQEPQ